MSSQTTGLSWGRDLIWVQTPFGEPAPRIVVAAARSGALGVLDLGTDAAEAHEALDAVARRTDAPFAVRVSARCPIAPAELPDGVHTVLVADYTLAPRWRGGASGADGGHLDGHMHRRVVAEVCSADEAREALATGVDGLVAKGAESGGRVGTTGAYLLCQQVLELTDAPVWVLGGIGEHTAAAAVMGGAAGVVLDSQVALLAEAALPKPVRAAVAVMDGSETRVVAGHRIYIRPDLWVADLDDRTSAVELVPRLGAASLTDHAVPVGQDGAFASGFAEAYGTVGRMVSSLRREIEDHARAARKAEPLAPGNGVSSMTGARYPVVQGPMTRVSDRPAFAHAVAEAGGLPFLALALLRGQEVRPLLEETAALLGDRPWGVGVLGFVPKELREEQLAVIHDVRPPLALIAGGRPAQATTLEEAGIRTFLHVPAPGLLERFLKDGARRFVFEGFECGGHVGPRSSFALWQTQLEVLTEWGASGGKLDELDVLFAGGIHDDRSAGMVAAMAGPLAERGARIGVLMGTAYLFTEEAVASGAIGEEFQAQALECQRTALLESGPGHVTRCAESPFVDMFERTRRDLIEAGADGHTRWAELENLNLGRLRVASKGLKREGSELVEVERDEQRSDGMFMIGDVATLRSDLGSISELHESVSAGATAYVATNGIVELQAEAAQVGGEGRRRPELEPADVAIIGMACVMPDAVDLDAFWRNIVEGANAITEVSPERWDPDVYFDPEWDHQTAHMRQGSASKWGGFLPDIPFDPFAYGIPPASLASIEPTQLLSLKVAADALADAGYADRPFNRENTSVIFGAEGGTDQSATQAFRAMYPTYVGRQMPKEMEEWLPKVTEDTFPGLLTNVISGRIANRLDLGGKNITVDAACASSLAAVDAACVELATGASDVVLAGGSDLHNGVQDFLLFTNTHALSTKGQCRTFDAGADGITLGEGVACVVLKRLEDAERDGDRIYAVIKSVAASSDGKSLGLTAPRQEGQERALRRAYSRTGVEANDVGLVEAHGTGTTVGDRTELATLTSIFSAAGMGPGECVVGSVKSNIGHTKCAAGLAGLIKAAKAVYHGVKPPTLHVEQPNEGWDPETSPFVFLDESRAWLAERRVAALSAFGFGGTNFHTVIESYDDDIPARALDQWPAELFVFRGEQGAVDKALAELAERLEEPAVTRGTGSLQLRDAAAAVASRMSRGPVRVAIVADDFDDLRAKLAHAREGRSRPGVYLAPGPDGADGGGDAGKVAFLFPGQGSQRPGMAADLFVTFTETRSLLRLGDKWAGVMLPPSGFDEAGRKAQREALTDTRVAQPALGMADLATARVLDRFGVKPGMVAGHSYGELVALCVAGALDETSLLELSEARANAILGAAGEDPGAMLAVSATREQLQPVLNAVDDVVIANDNHPTQLVVAGPTPAIDEAQQRLKDAGVTFKRLPVACAFHSPVVAGASEALAHYLSTVDLRSPQLTVFSNLTAEAYPDNPVVTRELVAGQVANGVRFTEEIQAMYDAGARIFVEVGPGRTLTGCVERILGDRPHVAVATDRPGANGVRSLLHALGQLAAAGVPVDIPELFEGRSVDARRWLQPARPAGWTINGHLVRDASGEVIPGGLRPATTAPKITLEGAQVVTDDARQQALNLPAADPATPAGGAGLSPDQALTEYFRTAQQIIGAGHQLLLNYLGVEPSQAYQPVPPPALAPAPVQTPTPAGLQQGPAQPAMPSAQSAPAVAAPPAPAPAPTVPAPAAGAPMPAAASSTVGVAAAPAAGAAPAPSSMQALLGEPGELLGRLTGIVSARTGYPEDMLDPDLDVEADLSIDSIKRLEILGELADQVGLADQGGALDELENLVEQLAARKTLRGIVDFLFEHAPDMERAAAEKGLAPAAVAPAPAAPSPAVAAEAAVPAVAAPASATAVPATAAAVQAPPAGLSVTEMLGEPGELLGRLTGIVSARTGYPEDMLDPDLDVEADLSIDSIKRLEILGELADQVGLADQGGALDELENLVEQLAARKTLRGIVDFLFEHAPDMEGQGVTAPVAQTAPTAPAPAAVPSAAPAPAPTPAAIVEAAPMAAQEPPPAPAPASIPAAAPAHAASEAPSPNGVPPSANRFVVSLMDAPLPDAGTAPARAIRVTGEGPLAEALTGELTARGNDAARISVAWGDASGAEGAGLVIVTDLFDGAEVPDLYRTIRPLLLDTGCDLLVVSPLGGGLGINPPAPRRDDAGSNGGHDADLLPQGAGARGLVKTAALEFPDRRIRLVDLDRRSGVEELARMLADEARLATAPVEVAWHEGRRRTPVAVPRGAQNGHATLPLRQDSVVLLTGGARGITARIAVALARGSGCHLHLVGRSTFPQGEEDPAFESCPDRMALRGALVRAGERDPKVIEKECDRILAEREIRQNYRAMSAAGSSVSYHQVDVRDATALTAVVQLIYARHGRLDGIVHGAGALDDHLIADKAPDAFERVFSTKVDSARTLLGAVRQATAGGVRPQPQFVAFFGSIAGVCGNRGQADYAAANDALDTMAATNRDLAANVFAIDWGPWSPEVGMVSDSLAKIFEETGMGMIQPDDGTAVMLDEIIAATAGGIASGGNGASGGNSTTSQPVHQVVAVRCSPEVMALSLSHGQGG